MALDILAFMGVTLAFMGVDTLAFIGEAFFIGEAIDCGRALACVFVFNPGQGSFFLAHSISDIRM